MSNSLINKVRNVSYNAILVDKDQYLLELARYVVLNPVRTKGMVRSLEDWPWSNYLAFIGHTKAQEWLTPEWVLSQFGRNKKLSRENYKRFVLEGVGQKIDIWSSLSAQIYLGDDTFVSKMQNKIENTGSERGVPTFAKAHFGHPCPSSRQKLNGTD